MDGKSSKGLIVHPEEVTDFNWSDAKTGCTNKGIGWHLPSIDELRYLYCAYNGAVPKKWTGNTGAPKKNMQANSSFNNKLTAANGSVLTDNIYWSGSEYDSNDAWFVDFTNGYVNFMGKSNSGLIRAVRAF